MDIQVQDLVRRSVPTEWCLPILVAMGVFDIGVLGRARMFLAQVAHESAEFKRIVENLNYSAAGLLLTWPRHFTEAEANSYQHQPERIANRAYANRNGNGDEASGDGWRYRGRGLIQITARGNYLRCGSALVVDLISTPALLETFEYAAKSAAWFWNTAGCNQLADDGEFEAITRKINGGLTGLEDRIAWLDRFSVA